MSRSSVDEVPFTFCDVVACFSEDEQKLLHDWQKELYNNVMKEIHQALNSLGPLIASSIFSLKLREMEEQSTADISDLEMKPIINPLAVIDATPEYEMFGRYQYTMETQDQGRRESHNVPRKQQAGFPVVDTEEDAALKDYKCSEIKVHRISVGPEPSICINEKGETYAVNIQECPSTHTGGREMTRNENLGNSAKHNTRSRQSKSTSNMSKENVIYSRPGSEDAVSRMWVGCDQETNTEKTEQIGHTTKMLCKAPIMAPSIETAHAHNEFENVMSNCNVTSKSNLLQSSISNNYPEAEKVIQNNSSVAHPEAHKAKRKYTCAECGKGFAASSTLMIHERIHTGERPYHCEICGKSFKQKGALHRHQISHTGEKPYQCNICGKRFNLKHNLVGHQKLHLRAQ